MKTKEEVIAVLRQALGDLQKLSDVTGREKHKLEQHVETVAMKLLEDPDPDGALAYAVNKINEEKVKFWHNTTSTRH